MTSMIKKIKQLSLDLNTSCTQLLNTTYYFAKKIENVELCQLCKQEIYGYADVSNIPEYRFIPVEYRMQSLNGRMIPLQIPFSDKRFSFMEKLPIKESIGELYNMYNQCKENYLFLSIPTELQTALNQLSDYPFKNFMELRVFAIFPKEQITKIANTIKMEIFNKIMEIEKTGNDFVDDLFEENTKNNENIYFTVNGNISDSILGNITKNGNLSKSNNHSVITYNYAEAERILKEINKQYKKSKIDRERQKQIARDIKIIKKAIKEKNDSLIRNGFEDIKNLLIGISGSVIASGIVDVIKVFLGA